MHFFAGQAVDRRINQRRNRASTGDLLTAEAYATGSARGRCVTGVFIFKAGRAGVVCAEERSSRLQRQVRMVRDR